MSYDVALLIQDAKGDELSVWDGNYASNMAGAWRHAGILIHEWDDGMHLARDVVDSLQAGIDKIKANRSHFESMEPDNGWGAVSGMLEHFLEPMLDAMERWPEARVWVWR